MPTPVQLEVRPRAAFQTLAVLALAAAALLRLAALETRPMHADEAVLADKFGTLLASGRYAYDPADHHGPVLAWLTLLPARLAGVHSHRQLSEALLRSVPAVLGILLAAAPLLLASELGWRRALAACALAAVSPLLVFYSRYFIPETPLVLFAAGALLCGIRYASRPTWGWACSAGAFCGLALATKETAVLLLGSMALAALPLRPWKTVPLRHAVLAAASGLAVLALLLGPDLGNLLGSFGPYAARAASGPLHLHPWYYYLHLLGWFRVPGGPLWSEAPVLLLALAGAIASFRDTQPLPRFLCRWAVLQFLLYSAVPYKTPWNAVGPWFGLILLAGLGIGALGRRAAALASAAALAVLAGQAGRAAFADSSSPANPYVYAHTTAEIHRLSEVLERIAAAHPDGPAMRIQVFFRGNVWPLPWYLRRFSRVGWWTAVPQQLQPAPLILVEPALEPELAALLYERRPPGTRELYLDAAGDIQLRPGIPIRAYAAKSVLDRDPAPAR